VGERVIGVLLDEDVPGGARRCGISHRGGRRDHCWNHHVAINFEDGGPAHAVAAATNVAVSVQVLPPQQSPKGVLLPRLAEFLATLAAALRNVDKVVADPAVYFYPQVIETNGAPGKTRTCDLLDS
jgi:hypothetical protein